MAGACQEGYLCRAENYLKDRHMNIYRNVDSALLLLRVALGGMMIYGHGYGKLLRLFGSEEISFSDPFGIGPVASLALAAFAEVVCALCVMLGLFTRLTVIPLIITMLVAAFYAHGADPFARQEKALMYLVVFIALLFTGGGYYSLDRLISNKRG